jgi:hypothetical protein
VHQCVIENKIDGEGTPAAIASGRNLVKINWARMRIDEQNWNLSESMNGELWVVYDHL